MPSLLEPLTRFLHHPRNKSLAFEHLAAGPWLVEQIGLHPGEQTAPLRAGLPLPQTLSTLTSNFLKLRLPVGRGRSQRLPQSGRDGTWGQGDLGRSQAWAGGTSVYRGSWPGRGAPRFQSGFPASKIFCFFQTSGQARLLRTEPRQRRWCERNGFKKKKKKELYHVTASSRARNPKRF